MLADSFPIQSKPFIVNVTNPNSREDWLCESQREFSRLRLDLGGSDSHANFLLVSSVMTTFESPFL